MVFATGRAWIEQGLDVERRAPRRPASGETWLAASDDPRAVARASREGAGYGYLFPAGAATPRPRADDDRRLSALAAAMADPDMPGAGAPTADAPGPVWAVFARIVAHDICALADLAPRGLRDTDAPRSARGTEAALVNLRDGRFRLASVYEPDAIPGPDAEHLARLMREPGAEARLRLDRLAKADAAHPGADLPRMARVSGRTGRAGGAGGSAALIGDRRNDADLAVSQMHVALIRFHNRVVEWLVDAGGCPPEQLFDRARRLTVRHAQWLALNAWLPRICDPAVLDRVRRAGAPVFRRMVMRRRRERQGLGAGLCLGRPDAPLPAPLEAWCAAAWHFRSLERARYDLNPARMRAPAELLRRSGGAWLEGGRLPADRAVDWSLWMDGAASGPDAVALDTRLAPEPDFAQAQAARALRTLRRGRALNLPSAQDCLAGFARTYSGLVRPLTSEALCGGHTGQALRDGLAERTPLFFYVLREAETLGRGARLGPLGSALMAEAVIGALVCDPASVWNTPGRGGGRWSPDLGARPDGIVVDGLEAFFAAAGGGA